MNWWWRAYDNAVDHEKLLLLDDKAHRAWFNLMCVSSANGGVLPEIRVVAVKLRVSPQRAAAVIAELITAGLFDKREDGKVVPHNWSKRQYKNGEEKSGEANEGEHKGKYVYFIGSKLPSSPVKIGISKNPWARVCELQTGHADKLALIATFRTSGPSEADLHLLLKEHRRPGGEWFDLPASIMDVVVSAVRAKSNYAALLLLLRSSYVAKPTSSYVAKCTESETETEDDKIGEARARSSFTEGSKALATAFWKALGFDCALAVPPEYAGIDWRAVEWERAGWTVDLISSETRRIGPGKDHKYYEKVFATAFAKRQAPLPIVEVKQAERVTVSHGTSQIQSSVTAAARRQAEYFEAQARDGIEGNPDAFLRLSSR